MVKDTGKNNNMPRRERERRRLREEVINAAAELFSAQSYEKTSVQQIAEKAEISVGTIYNLFEGKDSIFEGMLIMMGENIDSEVEEALNSIADPVERIRVVMRTYLDFCIRYKDFMLIIHNENPVKMKGMMKDFLLRQVERVESLFSDAVNAGLLAENEPHLLALASFGYINGLLHELYISKESIYGKEDFMSLFDRTLIGALHLDGNRTKAIKESR